MLILGIESTCDETAASVVRDGKEILSHVVRTQIETHRPYQGVFPELACRQHFDVMLPIIEETLKLAGIIHKDLDRIAVASNPGLIGAILTGVTCAKTLSLAWNLPLVGVNHVEAHLYAAMMGAPQLFPSLGVVISGGHTHMLKMSAIGEYELLGKTVDDAIGEAFDKVAALLDLSYPGGPEVEKLALNGDKNKYPFKRGTVKKSPLDFSFSGLKTNVLYTLKGKECQKKAPTLLPEEEKAHVAASFQHTALSDVVGKSLKAAEGFDCQAIYFGGGVSNNQYLRSLIPKEVQAFFPPKGLSLDNAAMIAGLAYHLEVEEKPLYLSASPRSKNLYPC
ncbi:MAG: tRNA (adenosine(37)-N6)-threonylcarbamoyltransferase complex transferase subunit TsaD [Chlamydiales bacterium]